MATRFTRSSSQDFTISSGLPAGNANFTWMAWLYIVDKDAGNWSAFFGPTINSVQLEVAVNGVSGGGKWVMWDGSTTATGTATSNATWYHVAITKSGATVTLYVNGVQELQQTSWPNTGPTSIWRVASYGAGSDYFNGRFFALKAWTDALSLDAIKQEIYTISPRNRLNVFGFWPGFPGSGQRTRDYSGNAHNWTEGGTPTDEDPPPIGWGASSGGWGAPSSGGVLVALIATAIARGSAQNALPIMRQVTTTGQAHTTAQTTARVTRLLLASAYASSRAQQALVRAVAVAAQARADGVSVVAVPEVRQLASVALAYARAAAAFLTAAEAAAPIALTLRRRDASLTATAHDTSLALRRRDTDLSLE